MQAPLPDSASHAAGEDSRTPIPLAYAGPRPTMRDDALDHGLAVASLVVAVIVCAPFVTGLISVAFGLVVLGRTRQVRPLERAMAALGTSIGAVQFSVWLFALAV